MQKDCLAHLVSPITHKKLFQTEEHLHTFDREEKYQIINEVPILLTENTSAAYHREIMEVLLWQYPDKINEMYAKMTPMEWPNNLFINYISTLLKDKNGILSAVREYSNAVSGNWINKNNEVEPFSSNEFDNFTRRNSEKLAAETVTRVRNDIQNEQAAYLCEYIEQVHCSNPHTIVELSTGMGYGTSAIADKKPLDCLMFSMDISYACHGNTISIANYLDIQDTLFPICANFWHAPFSSGDIDVVCSRYGLDESRDLNMTIAEISRMLKKGGRFINISQSNALFRQYNLLEPFGFTQEETLELLGDVHLFKDTNGLIEECGKRGLSLIERKTYELSDWYREVEVTTFMRQ